MKKPFVTRWIALLFDTDETNNVDYDSFKKNLKTS